MLQFRPSSCQKVRRQTFTQISGMLLPHYRALYKERGLLTASEKDIKNKEEIVTLLDAAWEPERWLQSYTAKDIKKRIPPRLGDRLTDKTPKQAVEGSGVKSEAPIKALVLAELPDLTLDSPKYSEAPNQLAKAEGAI